MRVVRIALVAFCLVAIPAVLQAQTWSPEQQELLDHLVSVWDQLEESSQSSFAQWQDVVHPRDDLVWWFTDHETPNDLEAERRWHQEWETRGAITISMSVRPAAVRILDSVGMIWFWANGEVEFKDGERQQWEDKRLEIFHKTSDGWEFVGGMVTPEVPVETDEG